MGLFSGSGSREREIVARLERLERKVDALLAYFQAGACAASPPAISLQARTTAYPCHSPGGTRPMPSPSWPLSAAALLLAAAGLAILLIALFRDRARGRPRCPRCWYSLAGLDEPACPECGHTPRLPESLYRTRRHWARALAGLALIAAGAATHAAPIVHRGGWYALAPTSLLVFLIPPHEQQWTVTGMRGSYHPAVVELSRRLERAGLRDWQWRTLIRRTGIIRCRDTWPGDQPLMVALERPHWMPLCLISVQQADSLHPGGAVGDLAPQFCRTRSMGTPRQGFAANLGPVPAGCSKPQLAVTVQWVPLAHGSSTLAAAQTGALPPVRTNNLRLHLPTKIVPTTADAIRATMAEDAGEALRQSIKIVRVSRDTTPPGRLSPTGYDSYALSLHAHHSTDPALAQIATGFILEALYDGEVVESHAVYPPEPKRGWDNDGFHRADVLFSLYGDSLHDRRDLTRWTIRLRGDPALSLVDWHKPTYWAGEWTWRADELLAWWEGGGR